MRVERAGPRDYIVERHLGPSNIRFIPKVKLDFSQVRDMRGKTPRKGSLGTFVSSFKKAVRRESVTTPAQRATQLRARERIMKPYLRFRIGAMRVRGK